MLNRRGFLKGFGAIVGGLAIEQAIPLGRVWSFPTEVKVVNATIAQYSDWINFSDLTAGLDLMDPVIRQMASELSYRAVLTGKMLLENERSYA